MTNQPLSTRPPNENEDLLRKKFYENIAAQSDLMDKLGGQLLTLELGIPGLFATVVKLTNGDKAIVAFDAVLTTTLVCWLAALVLTLVVLTPRNWRVDTSVLKQDPAKFATEGLGIEDFFTQSAIYKRRLLVASAVLFFAGIVAAIFTRVTP